MYYGGFGLEGEKILQLSKQESEDLGHYYLGVEHIFIALTKIENGLTQKVLILLNQDPKEMRDFIRSYVGIGDGHRYWDGIKTTRRCEKVLQIAADMAKSAELQVGESDMLMAILQEGNNIPVRLLQKRGIAIERFIKIAEEQKITVSEKKIPLPRNSKTPLLEKYGRDLTGLAGEGKLDPVEGRRKELLQIIRTLTRKLKCNPLLIGDAGVGKTAIVEGLACRIVQNKVMESLRDKHIIELNMASIVAGTRYRGEFEERITEIISEIEKHPEVIIFIDEIHTIVGAGSAEGTIIDAANVFKSVLARNHLKCIGATTIKEYRKYIEKDPALERRFQPIMIEELSAPETLEVLRKIKERYEKHHNVRIEDSALEASIKLTMNYVKGRFLPDKAMDALDEACGEVKIPSLSSSDNSDEISIRKALVTADHVAHVVSRWTGIPVQQLTSEEKDKLIHMVEALKKRIIGQDDVINRVSDVIKIAYSGLKDPSRPLGVFIFIGPTGVGKTELAKAIAEFLFGSDSDMVRLDMSEYQEKHSVSRLVGSPPGYIGYDEEGQLTEKLRRQPHSIVLLDEIEKAHPDILDTFLQVFDAGRLTDNKGRIVDARYSIFIMTSNIGTELYNKEKIGFIPPQEQQTDIKESVKNQLKKRLKPEFINRIDDILVFNQLTGDMIRQIAEKMIGDLINRLKAKGISISISEEALNMVCRKGYNPAYGARPLARTIEQMIAKPLSELLISGQLRDKDSIEITVVDNLIQFKKGAAL